MPWGGTGWLVDDGVVITNRHVAELVAEADGRGAFRFRVSPAGVPFKARLDFREEHAVAGAREPPLTRVRYLARSDGRRARPPCYRLRAQPGPDDRRHHGGLRLRSVPDILVPGAAIGSSTGLDFGVLVGADPLRAGARRDTLPGVSPVIALDRLQSMVL
jgi:hypothetical protein